MISDGRIAWREGAASAVLPVLVALGVGAKRLPDVLAGGLINPDSYMRMVRLRETLAQHHPAFVVEHDGSGHGTLLHWSHLLDSLIVALAAPFGLVLPPDAALHVAAMLTGPLFLAALGYAVAWAAAPFLRSRAERGMLWLGAMLVGLAPSIGCYGRLGVVHHHVAIMLATVAAAGWLIRVIRGIAPPRAGWRIGAWAGFGIWLTPEVSPLLLAVFGGLWLAWLTEPERPALAAAMRSTGLGFLLVIAAAFAVDPPYAGYAAAEIDRLSLPFLGLAVAIAGVGAATVPVDRATHAFRLQLPARAAAALFAGLLCLASWLAACPVVLHGTDSMLSAADWNTMFGHVAEMLPLTGIADVMQNLLIGMLGTALLAWLAWRERSPLLTYATLCAVGLLWAGAIHIRFAAYSATLAAVLLPIGLAMMQRQFAAASEAACAVARVAVITLVVLVPYAAGVPGVLAKAHAAEAKAAAAAPDCRLTGISDMLQPYAGQVVLADINDSPELLYRTGIDTVGSLYHRNVAGFLRLRAAWRSIPGDTVPDAVAATGAHLLLFCHAASRWLLVADLPPETLFDRLERGAPPAWLHVVATDPGSGQTLYRITP